MLKLIIADDEGLVRRGLKTEVDWSEYGIEVAGEAKDGEEALRLALDICPDIVITDIRMPNVDGLEFIRKIHQIDKDIKIIILSGYDDFAVAKEALKHGVLDYLLKPTDMDELDRVIRKATDIIREERERTGLEQKLRKKAEEKYFYELIDDGDVSVEEDIVEGWNSGKYCVLVLEQDNGYSAETSIALKKEIGSIKDCLNSRFNQSIVFDKNNQIVVILCITDVVTPEGKISDLCKEIKRLIENELGVKVAIGLGRAYSDVKHVSKSYEEARIAVNYKGSSGLQDIISVDDIEPQDYKVYELYIERIKSIEAYCNLRNSKKVSELVTEIFSNITSCAWISIKTVQTISGYLLLSLSKTLLEAGLPKKEIFLKEDRMREKIKRIDSIERIEKYVLEEFRDTLQYIVQREEKSTKVSINDISKYIEDNYNRDISLNEIGDFFSITPEYVSSLFKKERGENYLVFLSRLRIERATEMLRDSELKTYEIAERVGYYDTHHFSKVFKKLMGMTPSEYRQHFKK